MFSSPTFPTPKHESDASFALIGPPWAVNTGAVGQSETQNLLNLAKCRLPFLASPLFQVAIEGGVLPSLCGFSKQFQFGIHLVPTYLRSDVPSSPELSSCKCAEIKQTV